MEGTERLTLTPCPSLRELEFVGDDDDGAVHHESPLRISAVHRPDEEDGAAAAPAEAAEERRIGDGDSEFSFVLRGPETADEISSDGRVRPVYPVFGRHLLAADPAAAPPRPPRRSPLRKLLSEEREAPSASAGDELDGIPPETYCVWAPGSAAPAPARCRKSWSTGSLMRWRALSDLVVGRSHSDGREKFAFLAAEETKKNKTKPPIPNPNPNPSRGKEGKGEKSRGGKLTDRSVYYGKGSNSGGRRSFLPYKHDLIGFFPNMNGVSRTYHPF